MKAIPSVLLYGAMLAVSACSVADRSAGSPGASATPAATVASPAPTPTPAPAPVAPTAKAGEAQPGWYMEHDGMGMFQPCGQERSLAVDSADLRQRARDFGLEPDSPVYVRLSGTSDGSTFSVTAVDQFGSPVPVRDCSMTGTVIQ